MTVTTAMTVALRTGVSSSVTEYGSVLLDERSGDYFQLNDVGTAALRQLLDGHGPPAVAAILAEEYDVEPAQAEQDVIALLQELRTARLVSITP